MMNDMWGVNETVVAVGRDGIILRWDGAEWQHMGSEFTEPFVDVWGASLDDLYAMGNYEIRHWDGSSWTTIISGVALGDLWGSGPDDLYVVGTNGLAKRWDGSQWHDIHAPTSAELYACWGVGPDDFYAAGTDATVIHWDGSVWSHVDKPTGWHPYYVGLVWAASADDMVLAADRETYHKHNGTWTKVAVSHAPTQVRGSSANDIYLVGQGGFIMHWDGTTWAEIDSGTDAHLTAVWPDPAGFAYITGQGSILLRVENGAAVIVSESATAEKLTHVWSTGPDDIAAVSPVSDNAARIYHWDGLAWTMSVLEAGPVNALWGAGPNALFAICGDDAVFVWDGETWSDAACPANRKLRCLWGFSRMDLYAVACNEPRLSLPELHHWNGSTWSTIEIPTLGFPDVVFQSMWGAGPKDLWLAGTDRVQRWDGTTWSFAGRMTPVNKRFISGDGAGSVFLLDRMAGAYNGPATVLQWAEGDWQVINSTTYGVAFRGLVPLGLDNLVVGGGFRTLIHWDGSVWQSWNHQIPQDIVNLCPSGSRSMIAITEGNLYCWDGTIDPRPTLALSLSSARVQPGEAFWVRATLDNPTAYVLPQTRTYFALEVGGVYYFWPSWKQWHSGETPDAQLVSYSPGQTESYPVPSFIWPSTAESMSGLHFYSVALNYIQTAFVTNLAETDWGYGP